MDDRVICPRVALIATARQPRTARPPTANRPVRPRRLSSRTTPAPSLPSPTMPPSGCCSGCGPIRRRRSGRRRWWRRPRRRRRRRAGGARSPCRTRSCSSRGSSSWPLLVCTADQTPTPPRLVSTSGVHVRWEEESRRRLHASCRRRGAGVGVLPCALRSTRLAHRVCRGLCVTVVFVMSCGGGTSCAGMARRRFGHTVEGGSFLSFHVTYSHDFTRLRRPPTPTARARCARRRSSRCLSKTARD